jgi:hypothetical protein
MCLITDHESEQYWRSFVLLDWCLLRGVWVCVCFVLHEREHSCRLHTYSVNERVHSLHTHKPRTFATRFGCTTTSTAVVVRGNTKRSEKRRFTDAGAHTSFRLGKHVNTTGVRQGVRLALLVKFIHVRSLLAALSDGTRLHTSSLWCTPPPKNACYWCVFPILRSQGLCGLIIISRAMFTGKMWFGNQVK